MTDTSPLDRVRAVALLMPEASEADDRGATVFLVADVVFARVEAATLRVTTTDGDATLPLDDASDWTLVEDRIARSWELTAPAALLEAGGR